MPLNEISLNKIYRAIAAKISSLSKILLTQMVSLNQGNRIYRLSLKNGHIWLQEKTQRKIHKKLDLFGPYNPIYRQKTEIYGPDKIPFSYASCIREYYVKSDRIQGFASPCFPAFELNTNIYRVNLLIPSECQKTRTRKSPNTDTFCITEILCFIKICRDTSSVFQRSG